MKESDVLELGEIVHQSVYKTPCIRYAQKLAYLGRAEVKVTVPRLHRRLRIKIKTQRGITYELFPFRFANNIRRYSFELAQRCHRTPPL